MYTVRSTKIIQNLQEIAIGILANISCQQEIGSQIWLDQDLIKILVHSLMCDDTQTIIQVVRLLDTLIRSSKTESCTSLTTLLNTEALWKSIAFILQNSMNGKLKLCMKISFLKQQTTIEMLFVFLFLPYNSFTQKSYYVDPVSCSIF